MHKTLNLTSISPNTNPRSDHGLALLQVSSTSQYAIAFILSNTTEDLLEARIHGSSGSSYWLLELPAGDYRIDTVNGMRPAGSGLGFSIKSAAVNYIGDINIVPGMDFRRGNMLVYEGGFYKNRNLEGARNFLTDNYPRHSKQLPFIDAVRED
ncbi:hypothetical protein [Sorangium sp. So ce363]|uniref:hypothetical protein n=1 Tax=Sorangium sp. So ce363 TaxID=3133304 RepID=UPI003F5DD031